MRSYYIINRKLENDYIHGEDMEKRKYIIEKDLVPVVMKSLEQVEKEELSAIFLGVSGGIDSIALFHTWLWIRKTYHIPFSVIHIEHGLRGEDSQEDQAFVEELCKTNHVPFYWEQGNVLLAMKERNIGGLEEAARTIRYELFEKILKEYPIAYLYLAHHLDDQVETMLMNLLRGSGLKGLAGIPSERLWGNIKIVRPFLCFHKVRLKESLEEIQALWREDESNKENIGNRNILRNEILPKLYDRYPHGGKNIYQTTQIIVEEEKVWEKHLKKWMTENAFFSEDYCFFSKKAFLQEDYGVQRRIIRNFYYLVVKTYRYSLKRGMYDLDYKKTEELINYILMDKSKKINLPQNLFAESGKERIYFLKNEKPSHFLYNIYFPFDQVRINEKTWSVFIDKNEESMAEFNNTNEMMRKLHRNTSFQILNLSQHQKLTIRNRRQGDYIYLKGMEGKKTIKKLMIDEKIDRPLRDYIPLLVKDEHEVLWVANYGVSKEVQVSQKENNGIIIRYKYHE